MQHNKDNHRETLIIEIFAWAFVIGIFYMCAKAIFAL